ncbi:NAD(P)H-dependent oxidoreductase [Oxalobacter vibrioformis]|uniref:NAD(P)H-dependent oxidoreductase n=1 Tax=Oxalobacter vibrioformis TaxID=933080 RepID=A0A9E9LZ51_9BURK|nr:NAD(P)H-dependent oxidoreductase [Oxalobacter vibrioformis]WAW10330.1 NAD(P)H-dependent oxidoreductase [Oxalobacter vibrioformis]
MIRIAIIMGSTRPGRNGEAVAKWAYEIASRRTDAQFELIDLLDYNLPLLDEPHPAQMQQYTREHTKIWSEKINPFDGFVFVTPEYNHSTSAALKNAIDFLAMEWKNKVAAYVGYGANGAIRAVEHLRQIMAQFQTASIRNQLTLSLFTDFENNAFKPAPRHEKTLGSMLDQLVDWARTLKTLRKEKQQ